MQRAAAVVLISFAASALAHPGHLDGPLRHLLTEPDHLAVILLPLALAVGVWIHRRKARASRGRIR